MIIRSKYKLLCIKELQNTITEKELQKLNHWKERSVKNKIYFEEIKSSWNKLDAVKANPPTVNVQKEWAILEQELNKHPTTGIVKIGLNRRFRDAILSILSVRRYLFTKPVFVSIVILVAALSVYIFLNRFAKTIEQQTFTASNKQKVNVQLSDGSSIKLNSGSSVTVQDEFDKHKREVRLSGEAYFEVVKEKRPCIVLTDNAQIEVLGTSFNVWSRNNITRVVVKEGVVRLSSLKDNSDYVLIQANAMSQVMAGKNPDVVKPVKAERIIGWPEGKLIFEHSALSEMIEEIERQYNVKIFIPLENPDNFRLTGVFDNLTIEQVLSSVCLTLDLEYKKITQDHFIIKTK